MVGGLERRKAWAGLVWVVLVAACTPTTPSLPAPTMQARCRVGGTQTGILVTELPGSEKSNLEALLRGGAVAVEFSGCAMRLIPECQLGGEYQWQATTPATDILEISNESELYAKLPLGAASLGAELKRSGSLYVETTVAGQHRLVGVGAHDVPNSYACELATHVVSGVSLGAFVMSAGGSRSAGGNVGAGGVEGGRNTSHSAKVVRYAGNPDQCYGEVPTAPPVNCASPVQVFLSPIPGKAEVEGPPGSVKADFVSDSPTVRWDVYVDDQATCTTPCSHWVDPSRPVVLRSRPGTDKLQVRTIDGSRGPVQIVAEPRSNGKLATGITFTALGGLAVLTGVSLAGIGCSDEDRDSMCSAGQITGGIGLVVGIGGIWLIRQSFARYKVRPIFVGGAVEVGPGYVAGTF